MRSALIFILVILVGLIGSTIQAGELINYQGRLTDAEGNPVADDTYQLTFSLYDDSTGGFLQWSEVHPSVQTEDGLFCVILGSVFELDASIFEIEPLYLEIQVGVEVISPRTRLTSAPSAIRAKNMSGGDIETGEGFLRLMSSEGATAVSIHSEEKAGPAYLTMFNPDVVFPDQALVEMRSESTGGSIEFFPAGDMPHDPAIRMGFDPSPFSPGRLEFFDPTGSLPHDPYVRMGFEPMPFAGGKLEFFDPGSGWPDNPMIAISTEPGPFHAASFRMFNPVPEPPARIMEMSVNESAGEWGSYFDMYTIDPSDDKVFRISNTASSGVSIKMIDPSDDDPVIQINTGADRTIGGSIRMFNPQPEPPRVYFDLNATPTTGASMNIYDDIGKVMGVEPVPFNSGCSIKLFNPQPEPPKVIAEIAGSYDGKGGTGRVAVYDDADHLQSFLTPARLLLNYAFGDNFGPPVSLEASASEAKVGIGTYTPNEPLVIGNDFGTLGGDWIVIGNSKVGEVSGLVAGEDVDSCGWINWLNNDNCWALGAQGVDIMYLKDGKVGIGTNGPTEELHVVGDICYTGSIGACSDVRYKKDIQTIGDAVETLLKLRGISYSWRQDEYPDMKFDDQKHLGFVAQEIKDLVPGVVLVDDNGDMSVDYGRITPLLVQAVKEQQGQIKQLNAQITELQEALEDLQAANRY